MSSFSRREFISQSSLLGLAGLATLSSIPAFAIAHRKAHFKFGYAAITWGDEYLDAIKEIGGLGFKGIQLRANVYKTWKDKPMELYQKLAESHIEAPVFSGGNADFNTPDDEKLFKNLVEISKFARNIGVKYVQFTNFMRPKNGPVTPTLISDYCKLLNKLGDALAEMEMVAVYHNHMDQLGETAEEIDAIMAQTDPDKVKLLLDVAHITQGGGDPNVAIKKHHNRIPVIHLKDVRTDSSAKSGYKFVELGKGRIDWEKLFNTLDEVKFKGWGIVELDAVPEPGQTALQCATTSKAFLTEKMKFKIG